MSDRLKVRVGRTQISDAVHAADAIREQTRQDAASVMFLFCSPRYDLDRLGEAINEYFDCPVLACTTAGEFSSAGYTSGGIVAASLASPELTARTLLIDDLPAFEAERARDQAQQWLSEQTVFDRDLSRNSFGLLLVDGLSMCEERLAAALDMSFCGLPIAGGSAGDDLAFEQTRVYHGGKFHSGAAVFALVQTTLPFKVFKSQHLEPTDRKVVITASDPRTRTVSEIDGIPAAVAYASAVGVEVEELTPETFSTHPVVLRVGGNDFVRSIQKVNPDGSLTFYCAIDDGLVLTVARGEDLTGSIERVFTDLRQEIPGLSFILAYDCILRRLEAQRLGLMESIKSIVEPYDLVGFSTYGEQCDSLHVNQTLTGVAIGQ
ncbi:MAG TPA: hypothetical protein ENK10_03620 [Acidobacteria bacterium]|nr:hypothetical protein [Acidobacteriota bacterium]